MTADRIALRAGPLEMAFDPAAGWLRRVRLGGREVLRAVYPAVRDRYWNTLPNRVSNLAVEADATNFRLAFDAVCRQGPIDFAFRGEVVGTADGTVTYRFDGEPRSAFQRNRIGLCVLHPIDGCAGRPCTVEHTDGAVEPGRFPAEIAPHQPFHDVRAITHEVFLGVSAEVRFEGDVFETEDQRNWTDASFKTYSTPLARPHPVEVSPGTPVRQAVTLRLTGVPPPCAQPAVSTPTVDAGGRRLDRLPRIGFGASLGPIEPSAAGLLRLLRPDHLRVDLTPSGDGTADRLRAAAAEAAALGTSLEAAVLPGDDPDAELRRLADAARAVGPRVGGWLVCRGPTGAAGADDLALARRHLAGLEPAARFGVGTNLYFTQLNRGRPPLGDADFVGFSVNPQVHAFDDESVVETLDGQAAVVENARRLAAGRGVAVTPVTLRPRFNPNGGPAEPPDPRQASPFAAAWALGSVRRLAAAGAASATYFETTGPGGLLAGDTVFPVYHLFAALAGAAGWDVDTCRCSHPLRVEGLLFRNGDLWFALVANLTAAPCEAALPFAAEGSCLVRPPGGGPQAPVAGGRFRLGPYEVARVEPADA